MLSGGFAKVWSVLGCGGDGAVVVCRQVSNASDGVEFVGFAGSP